MKLHTTESMLRIHVGEKFPVRGAGCVEFLIAFIEAAGEVDDLLLEGEGRGVTARRTSTNCAVLPR
ncbi:hypothetical protein [Rhodococcus erythropolis]|uniref:Uncharacterized protein n=1 Tax=Rhodococcus erythropolis TaxID=1833 RepID=A0A8I1D840_RHOER|nr:hypothetical protein [Rhodococcus erythropolis]MBH5144329.1 hypothetical protein [Rhodococcus erythropolis]